MREGLGAVGLVLPTSRACWALMVLSLPASLQRAERAAGSFGQEPLSTKSKEGLAYRSQLQPQVVSGLQAGAGPGVPGGSGTVTGILVCCHKATTQERVAFSEGRSSQGWGGPEGMGLPPGVSLGVCFRVSSQTPS